MLCGRCGAARRVARLQAEASGAAELFFDAQEVVVLGDALGARRRAGLDLAAAGGHGQVGDERVLGLAGAMRDDRASAGAVASSMVAKVSVSVPIWLSLIRIALARPR